MKKKLFTCLVLAICSNFIYAQSVDQVTLVVSSDGATKEEAINRSLRSAVEQAYGVFVSANTEILNDELVKDEIATVSSGNIESYKELSSAQLPTGGFLVSLQATVSTKKLTAYAKSKGSSCEFAGATFGANLKMAQLNAKNTKLAFENLIKECELMIPYCYDVELEMGMPKSYGEVEYTLSYYSNKTTYDLSNHILSTLQALKLSEDQVTALNDIGIKPIKLNIYRAFYHPSSDYRWETMQQNSDSWRNFPIQYGGFFYTDFPLELYQMAFENNLAIPYIVDNLGNQYELSIWYSDPIIFSTEYVEGYEKVDNYSSCFYGSPSEGRGKRIMLPKILLTKKKKEYTYRQLIGVQTSQLNIPAETLMQISNFFVKLKYSSYEK